MKDHLAILKLGGLIIATGLLLGTFISASWALLMGALFLVCAFFGIIWLDKENHRRSELCFMVGAVCLGIMLSWLMVGSIQAWLADPASPIWSEVIMTLILYVWMVHHSLVDGRRTLKKLKNTNS